MSGRSPRLQKIVGGLEGRLVGGSCLPRQKLVPKTRHVCINLEGEETVAVAAHVSQAESILRTCWHQFGSAWDNYVIVGATAQGSVGHYEP